MGVSPVIKAEELHIILRKARLSVQKAVLFYIQREMLHGIYKV